MRKRQVLVLCIKRSDKECSSRRRRRRRRRRERERGKKEIFLPGLFFLSFFLFGSGRFFIGGGSCYVPNQQRKLYLFFCLDCPRFHAWSDCTLRWLALSWLVPAPAFAPDPGEELSFPDERAKRLHNPKEAASHQPPSCLKPHTCSWM